ncbi:MAG: GNAT family N-acetyltransferase [Candidatus Nitrosotenuis sp.]
MIIRKARPGDKKPILSFLHKTFQWGDYIERVWDHWLAKKTLHTVEEDGRPIGICNASFSKHQVWLEGLRIHPKFRRRGYASRLVLGMESLAAKKGRKMSRMLIAKENTRSLKMAKSLGYKIESRWWLYNLRPKRQHTDVRLASNPRQLQGLMWPDSYSESWEWFLLDKKALNDLIKKKRVLVAYQDKKLIGIGIWNKSYIDRGVLQMGYINGTKPGMKMILHFMQNKAHQLKSKRVQVLAPQKIKLNKKILDKRMLFCLMKKDLR